MILYISIYQCFFPLLCCKAHCCRLDNTSCLRRTCIASEAASVLYELFQTSAATQWWPLRYRRQAAIWWNLCNLKPRGGQSHFLSAILLQQQVVRNGSKKWRVTIGGVPSSFSGLRFIGGGLSPSLCISGRPPCPTRPRSSRVFHLTM